MFDAPTAILVIRGFWVSSENSAVHMRDDSSGQRTVRVSAVVAIVTGPGRTAVMSAGTMAAQHITGTRKMKNRMARLDNYNESGVAELSNGIPCAAQVRQLHLRILA